MNDEQKKAVCLWVCTAQAYNRNLSLDYLMSLNLKRLIGHIPVLHRHFTDKDLVDLFGHRDLREILIKPALEDLSTLPALNTSGFKTQRFVSFEK